MANATQNLAQFRIVAGKDGQSAQLHIEDDSGATLELNATREQLDLIADELDKMLDSTENADEV